MKKILLLVVLLGLCVLKPLAPMSNGHYDQNLTGEQEKSFIRDSDEEIVELPLTMNELVEYREKYKTFLLIKGENEEDIKILLDFYELFEHQKKTEELCSNMRKIEKNNKENNKELKKLLNMEGIKIDLESLEEIDKLEKIFLNQIAYTCYASNETSDTDSDCYLDSDTDSDTDSEDSDEDLLLYNSLIKLVREYLEILKNVDLKSIFKLEDEQEKSDNIKKGCKIKKDHLEKMINCVTKFKECTASMINKKEN